MNYLEELAVDGNPLIVNRNKYIEFTKQNFSKLKILNHKDYKLIEDSLQKENNNLKADVLCDYTEKEKMNFEPQKKGLF